MTSAALARAGVRAAAFLTGMGVAGLASLAGSVVFVRATAAGHLYAAETVPPAPVALVLGAKVFPGGMPSPFLAARLDLAHRLYRAGRAAAVLVSGDRNAPEYDEPAAMRAYLIASGMPADAIVSDGAGFDTYQSAVRARRVFGLERLIVVTQSYHLPRAVATCRALGLDAVGVGDDTVRSHRRSWRRGVLRDQVACVKTVVDLVSPRCPKTARPAWPTPSPADAPPLSAPCVRITGRCGARSCGRKVRGSCVALVQL